MVNYLIHVQAIVYLYSPKYSLDSAPPIYSRALSLQFPFFDNYTQPLTRAVKVMVQICLTIPVEEGP